MLAKVTSKNQITIPKKIMAQLPAVSHFDMEFKDGVVVMTPVSVYDTNLAQIRDKMQKLGLSADSVREAVAWARGK